MTFTVTVSFWISGVPDPPIGLEVQFLGDRIVRFSWSPGENGYESLLGYILEYRFLAPGNIFVRVTEENLLQIFINIFRYGGFTFLKWTCCLYEKLDPPPVICA